MTKQSNFVNGAGDRPARISKLNRDESFPEKLDRFIDGLQHIEKRRQDRLALQEAPILEMYLKGKIIILIEFKGVVACHQVDGRAVFHNYIAYLDNRIGGLDGDRPTSSNLKRWDNKVVLIEFVELGNGPQEVVSVPVRLYRVEDETIDLRKSGSYWGLFDHVLQVRPLLMERESAISTFLGLPPKRHPNMVQCGTHVMNCISDNEWDSARLTNIGECDSIGTVRLHLRGKVCETARVDLRDQPMQLVNVMAGPLNL
jgi:hypothetical protein